MIATLPKDFRMENNVLINNFWSYIVFPMFGIDKVLENKGDSIRRED